MLPWGPPDTKFSLGTPKSHIGKPWNFAKLTHGPLNSYHREVSGLMDAYSPKTKLGIERTSPLYCHVQWSSQTRKDRGQDFIHRNVLFGIFSYSGDLKPADRNWNLLTLISYFQMISPSWGLLPCRAIENVVGVNDDRWGRRKNFFVL